MNFVQSFCQWLYDIPSVTALRESDDAYPILETAHVLGICLMVGTIAVVDLRLTGLILRDHPAAAVSRALLPCTWAGFALMAVTGLPLFAAESVSLYDNPAFRIKLLLLALAGCNALLFHRASATRIGTWGRSGAVPWHAQAFAWTSLVFWFAIVVLGRLIAVFRAHGA